MSATALVRQKNVGRASTRIGDHPGSLLSWAQGSCLGCGKQDISNVVVTRDPIPVSPTADLMVSHCVCIEATYRALIGIPVEGDPQPVSQRVSELLIVDVKAKGGRRNDIGERERAVRRTPCKCACAALYTLLFYLHIFTHPASRYAPIDQ